MSLHIGAERRLRAMKPPEMSEDAQPHTFIRLLALFACTTAFAGVVLLSVGFPIHEWRLALLGSTLLVIASAAGVVLGVHLVLADRQEYFRRGELVGWMRGWRGEGPESGDSLLRG